MNTAEQLCQWYLRLNGYFTIPNFYAHGRPGPLTEVDVLAVRFPFSTELEFEDDKQLAIPNGKIDVIFAEVKNGKVQELNGPWSSAEGGALDYVLRRIGVIPVKQVDQVAKELYQNRKASFDSGIIRIACFARGISEELRQQGVTYVGLDSVLDFIHQRFFKYQRFKRDIQAWDRFGQYLWQQLSTRNCPPVDDFFRNAPRDL